LFHKYEIQNCELSPSTKNQSVYSVHIYQLTRYLRAWACKFFWSTGSSLAITILLPLITHTSLNADQSCATLCQWQLC